MKKKRDIKEFDYIANNIFAPAYPLIAKDIVDTTGILEGNCLDIGSASGHLGFAYLDITNTKVCMMDIEEEAIDIAKDKIKNRNLSSRVEATFGDVHNIPLNEDTMDLVISRGSLWFWDDKKIAFKEIKRVLKHNGYAYLGCGFGSKEVKEEIDKKMLEIDPNWKNKKKEFSGVDPKEEFTNILKDIGIKDFNIVDDHRGFWVIFKK